MKQERLTKILDNTQTKLIKANKSLERLNKQLAKEKTENEYTGCTESDIKRKQREIEDLKKSIESYNQKLKEIQNIEEIPVLREFINNWKI